MIGAGDCFNPGYRICDIYSGATCTRSNCVRNNEVPGQVFNCSDSGKPSVVNERFYYPSKDEALLVGYYSSQFRQLDFACHWGQQCTTECTVVERNGVVETECMEEAWEPQSQADAFELIMDPLPARHECDAT